MKAIISSTTDSKYFFFIPIVTWLWNKLGVDVVCFMPENQGPMGGREFQLLDEYIERVNLKIELNFFSCPEDKDGTYAQCSRLYGACLDLQDDEVLITSDVDMATFGGFNDFLKSHSSIPQETFDLVLKIVGADLTPKGQYPMCYAIATVRLWRKFMQIDGRTYQQCLDHQLSGIECENFRGNMWSRDQELLVLYTKDERKIEFLRANPGTQFASCRADRTDTNWRSYLGPSLVDAHLWREGYTDENFANIMELLATQYPEDSFDWLISYRNEYIKLL